MVLVLVLLVVLLYFRSPTRVIYIYIPNIYISGTKYEVRGRRCPDVVSWKSYTEGYEYWPDFELIVDCRKMAHRR